MEWIAYCGVDCAACSDLREEKCPCCRRTAWTEDDICRPVECCRSKSISFCGECSAFPCGEMAEFYHESESHEAAYVRMASMGK